VSYNIDGAYTVNVDVAGSHGATQFAANNADVTLNITGPSYSITGLMQIGKSGKDNDVVVGGSTFITQDIEIAHVFGRSSLTVNGPMQSGVISVGGQIDNVDWSPHPFQIPGGRGTLSLNTGANITADVLLGESAGSGSQIVFNGGTMTISSHARPGSTLNRIGDGTSSAVLNLVGGDDWSYHYFGTGSLLISNNAILNYNCPDGVLTVGNIVSEGGSTPGVFNWVAGYLDFYSAPLELSASSLFGANLTLTSERRLSAPAVVITNGASLTIDGGEIGADTIVTNPGGTMTFTRGKLFVGTGDLPIGPGGITNPSQVTLNANDFIAVENGELSIAAGHSLVLNGGGFRANTISNHGTLTLNSGNVEVNSGGLVFGPTGQFNVPPNFVLGLNTQVAARQGEVLIEPGQSVTIERGTLLAGTLSNQGTLLFNRGILALHEGDLTIGPTGQLRNQPTLTINNGSAIYVYDHALNIQATQTVNLVNGFINVEAINLDGTFNVGQSVSLDTVTMGPTGQLTVTNGNMWGTDFTRTNLAVSGGSLIFSEMSTPAGGTHNNALTISGGSLYARVMSIGAAPGYVDTVTINGGRLTTEDLTATGGAASVIVFNKGWLSIGSTEIDGPSTFVVGDGTGGTNAARLSLQHGFHYFADGLAISANARLEGLATINGDVSNAGTIEPGSAFGPMTINGNLVNSGTLRLEYSSEGFEDKLAVNGTFTAGGVIRVVTYQLDIGDSFDLMDFTTFVDNGFAFDFSSAAPLPGSHWDTSEFTTTGRIHLVADNGDFNQDGVVDAADYVAWRKGSGASPSQANHNLWRTNFGETSGGEGQGGTVPEPAAIAMLLAVALAAVCRCRAWAR
jgi:hypothetical protein